MQSKRAFTYIELTLVGAIVAVLAAIAVPNFLEARIRAAVSRSKNDLALVKMGVEAYRLEQRRYPMNAVAGVPSPGDLVAITTPIAYMASLPRDFFTTNESGKRGASRQTDDAATLNYYNAFQVRGEAGLQFTGDENPLGGGYIAGLLWGLGPATAYPLDPATSPTKISAEGVAELIAYDPTNGTTSRGDIYLRLP